MNEPRCQDEYESRQVKAARRVIVDVMQVVEFHNSPEPETRDQHSRRTYELVRTFLGAMEKDT